MENSSISKEFSFSDLPFVAVEPSRVRMLTRRLDCGRWNDEVAEKYGGILIEASNKGLSAISTDGMTVKRQILLATDSIAHRVSEPGCRAILSFKTFLDLSKSLTKHAAEIKIIFHPEGVAIMNNSGCFGFLPGFDEQSWTKTALALFDKWDTTTRYSCPGAEVDRRQMLVALKHRYKLDICTIVQDGSELKFHGLDGSVPSVSITNGSGTLDKKFVMDARALARIVATVNVSRLKLSRATLEVFNKPYGANIIWSPDETPDQGFVAFSLPTGDPHRVAQS